LFLQASFIAQNSLAANSGVIVIGREGYLICIELGSSIGGIKISLQGK
jgi:hypothetical protein